MSEETDSYQLDSGLICSWCGRSFSPESTGQAGAVVCSRCVRRLKDAGISDQEIYGEPSDSKKAKAQADDCESSLEKLVSTP